MTDTPMTDQPTPPADQPATHSAAHSAADSKPPRVATHKITRVVPPVWVLLALMLMYLLNWVVPLVYLLPNEGIRIAGRLMILAGLAMVFLSIRQFRQARTPLKPFVPVKALITDGMFRYSRNPVYVGMILLLTGWAVYLGSLTPWLVVGLFVWAIRRFWVIPEEGMMERSFGAAYVEYKEQVRRWL